MTVEEILEKFEYVREEPFPEEALKEAIEKREELVPKLIENLVYTKEHAEELNKENNFSYFAHIFSIFLLGYFHEERARESVLGLLKVDPDYLDFLFGDMTTEDFPYLFANISQGDTDFLCKIVYDESIDVWTRSAALESLTHLVAIGVKTREEILSIFREIYNTLPHKDENFWVLYVMAISSLYPEEMKDELYKLLDELTTGSAPKFESRELNELFARDRDTVLKEELYGKTHTQEELIESLEFWYDNMLEYYNRSINEDEDEEIDYYRSSETEITGTYHRTEPKIGRNDPCPCGSGKKYKNCHGKPGAAQEI